MSQVKKDNSGIKEPLELVWNGIYQEHALYQKLTLGKILTIIDAVIVEPKQNKSVKDLITGAVYQYPHTEMNMAKWLNWLKRTNKISPADCDEHVPMNYAGIPVAELKYYEDKK